MRTSNYSNPCPHAPLGPPVERLVRVPDFSFFLESILVGEPKTPRKGKMGALLGNLGLVP